MPEILDFGIIVPGSDLEPPDGYGALRDLGESVVAALTRPYVHLDAAALTSIANSATGTKVDLDTTVHNDTDYFSVTASVVTILQDGLYDLSAISTGINAGTTGIRETWISKNGVTTTLADARAADVVSFGASLTALNVPLQEGDTVQLCYAQVSGAARNTIHSADYVSRLVVRKVG